MKAFHRHQGAVLPALALTAAIGLGAVSACSGSGTPARHDHVHIRVRRLTEQQPARAGGERRVDGDAGRGG